MPFNTSIYQQLQPNIAGQLAGSINEFVDRRARLSDLAAQREQQAITQGYQNRAAQRVEEAYPAQQADLELKRKKEADLQANLLLVNQALASGDTKKAKQLFAGMYPEEAAKEMFKAPKTEPMSSLGQLQAERERLALVNPSDPRLTAYDQAINKAATHPPIAPATSIVQGGAGTFAVTTPRTPDGTSKVQNLGIAPKQDTTLVQVQTPEGVIYTTRPNAVGMAAPIKTPPASKQDVVKDAIESNALLKQAEKVGPLATGSGLGAARDYLGSVAGISTEGAKAAAQMKVLGASLTAKVPKMSGPQSDKDVAMYKEAAGNIANEKTPWPIKLAAIQTIREINNRQIEYAKQADTQKQPATPSATSANTVTLPDGQTKTFSSPAAAQAFRKAAGL